MKRCLFAVVAGVALAVSAEPKVGGDAPSRGGVTTNLFLLVGQSNMAGRGRLRGETPVSSDRIVAFDENGQAKPATEPLHHDLASAGAGLAMSFARAYADEHPGEVVGLLPCAMGGSAIATWKPGVGKNYRAAIEMVQAVRGKGRFAGILWHQGENNATTEARLKGYAENLREVIAGFRRDVADVPFVAGELGSFLAKRMTTPKDGGRPVAAIPYWREINRLTREVCASTPRCACVETADLTPNGDNLHFNTASLRTLGLRYYAAWKSLSAEADSFRPKPLGGRGGLVYPDDFAKKPVFRAPPVRKPGLVLVDGGRVVTVVTPGQKERPDLWKLGQELQYHLSEMSGRPIPHVESAKRPAEGPVIVIGNDAAMDAKGTMVIRRTGDELYLGGGAEGPSHALTYVLEALGCRYLWPGKSGKIIPKRSKVVLPEIDLAIEPELSLMRIAKLGNPGESRSKEKILPAYGYDFNAYYNLLFKSERGFHDKMFNRDFWQWHGVCDAGVVRYGTYVHGGAVSAGHYFGDYYAKYAKDHPDWFAEQPNGSRVNTSARPRLCLSNEGLIEEVIRDRVAALKANTNLVAVSISQPDGSYDSICYCENCRKLDVENQEWRKTGWIDRKTNARLAWDYPFVTDRVLTFANKVMEGVLRECPGKHLGIFSYSNYDRPPKRVKPHPGLIFFNVAGDYRCKRDADWARKSLAAWLSFGNPVVWRPNCMNFLRASVPCDVSRKIFTDIELAKANGCVGVSLDCVGRSNATRPLTYYMAAKAMLNPDRLDYEWYVNDFCKTAFGPAASVMRGYFDELQAFFDRIAAEVPDERNVGRYVARFDIPHFQAILDRAKAAAKDDPDVLARLAFLQIALGSAVEVRNLYLAWDSQDRKRLDAQRERFKKFIRESNMSEPNALGYPGFRTPFMAGGVRAKDVPSLRGEADDRGNVITNDAP